MTTKSTRKMKKKKTKQKAMQQLKMLKYKHKVNRTRQQIYMLQRRRLTKKLANTTKCMVTQVVAQYARTAMRT